VDQDIVEDHEFGSRLGGIGDVHHRRGPDVAQMVTVTVNTFTFITQACSRSLAAPGTHPGVGPDGDAVQG
jgi:hypothetical protein